TPSTPIVETFAKFVADGKVDTEMVRVESEHSSMSACVGASAAGVRVMTATSSAGLALMWEILGVASGMRLPIIMSLANRALSGPINIHCDHSDAMGARDLSWIQIFSEDAQEAYENTLLAVRLAEHPDVLLPAMVCQDGFITSHGVQNVTIQDDITARKFLGERKPWKTLLNINDPVTFGPLELTDYYFETKRQQEEAMTHAKRVFLEVGEELSQITGNKYGYFEEYQTKDADAVIVAMNSTAGTAKSVIDRMRKEGKKVGLLKIRLFRPFAYDEVGKALSKAKTVGVLDRSASFGAHHPLFSEIRNSLYDIHSKPGLQSYLYGLGGRDIYEKDIEKVFLELLEGKTGPTKYIGLRG
ncbi:MAG: pyruvate ferredoxin oxidoreductase, partial [Candidatus Aenigmarchaeota archaeon]|nr:pyruvate ferredoxin oxidoreductase [Candidatus Aenigmarchaeota archaeon]